MLLDGPRRGKSAHARAMPSVLPRCCRAPRGLDSALRPVASTRAGLHFDGPRKRSQDAKVTSNAGRHVDNSSGRALSR
eukprot:1082812-Pyramimonas_sp.AAC.1